MRGQQDSLVFFSLDLSDHRDARVKVYITHSKPTVEHLESLMTVCPNYVSGEAHRFCQTMMGSNITFGSRSPLTCFAFTSGNDAPPFNVTLQLPLRDYVDNDAIAKQRIENFLSSTDRKIYKTILAAIADRPLEAGVGLHSFVSFTRYKGQPRTALYFALEGYRVLSPRSYAMS